MKYFFFITLFVLSSKIFAQSLLEIAPYVIDGVIAEVKKSKRREQARNASQSKRRELKRQFKKQCPELTQIFNLLPQDFRLKLDKTKSLEELDILLIDYYIPYLEKFSDYLEIDLNYTIGDGAIEVPKCQELTNNLIDDDKKRCMLELSIPSKCVVLHYSSYFVEQRYSKLSSLKRRSLQHKPKDSFIRYFFRGSWLPKVDKPQRNRNPFLIKR